ncbi:MAG: DEAD/DEAH box helicase [Gammaproteobacteria bacterium]|nr:MAG: DEAD/DEAH box helicase [Gammaproteobacteria bacterium]
MNSSASNSDSTGFGLLDTQIQKWVWSEGWTSLRDAQERAIPALINADQDVIIAAQTAAGKTEAAFLPILSHLLRDSDQTGTVLYVSPLKALINDQWGRLTGLCEQLDINVTPWHGDITATKKNKFLKEPKGILLITPESLEAMFVNRGSAISALFANLKYIVIDELHAFIGSERGKQLQSLMNRIELATNENIPRIGLSATLGDMSLAATFLRNQTPNKVLVIDSKSGNQELQILVKGFVQISLENTENQESVSASCTHAVAAHLFKNLRASNNLIFPNSRTSVELYSDYLRRLCEDNAIPNVFWPHHGNLSKEIREETEQALKDNSRPANAICTSTLELGIDIGAVKSIAQIGPPPSVASLRQRLGRSGRRKGEPAILRGYCIEPEINANSAISDKLHEGLIQSVAMINLLLKGWFEPPAANGLHASTLVQQILSIIAEKGGISVPDLWRNLSTSFLSIQKNDFLDLLKVLGEKKLIIQESSGLLLHGELGEKLVNHYEFYSAFVSDDEMRLECNGKSLGSLSVSTPMLPGQGIIFAGRRWRVLETKQVEKVIIVKADKGGAPPLFSSGDKSLVHDGVRKEMYSVLADDLSVKYLDETGQQLLSDARSFFKNSGFLSSKIIEVGKEIFLMTWCGDIVNNTLAFMFQSKGFNAINEGVGISISDINIEKLHVIINGFLNEHQPNELSFLEDVDIPYSGKWDWALPKELLKKSYCSNAINFNEAMLCLKRFKVN